MAVVGCTRAELASWIEYQFQYQPLFEGQPMSWENRHLWHLDHEIPLASASLLPPEQREAEILRLSHFLNLRPLWGQDNLAKSDKLPDGTSVRSRRSFLPPPAQTGNKRDVILVEPR